MTGPPGMGPPSAPQYGSPYRPGPHHEEGSGLFGRIRNLFSGDDKPDAQPQRRPPGYQSSPQYGARPPPPAFPKTHPQQTQQFPPPGQHYPQPQQQSPAFNEPQIHDLPSSGYPQYSFTPPPPPEPEPTPQVSSEPQVQQLIPRPWMTSQVFVVEDSIVLILRPQEFYRKKSQIARAGPGDLQVRSLIFPPQRIIDRSSPTSRAV